MIVEAEIAGFKTWSYLFLALSTSTQVSVFLPMKGLQGEWIGYIKHHLINE